MAEDKNKIIKEAKIEMNYLTGEEEVRRLAELRDKWESDRVSELSFAAKQEKIKMAKKLVDMKMNIDEISKITELSKEEIKKLNK